jgi:hypothetical protein
MTAQRLHNFTIELDIVQGKLRIPHKPAAAAQTDEFDIIIGGGCILKGKLGCNN